MTTYFSIVNTTTYAFSSDWALVAVIGLVFFLVQIALTLSFCRRIRRQERTIQELECEFELGCPCEFEDEHVRSESGWADWVLTHFPVGRTGMPANFTREDALQELDSRLASDSGYLLLQRMGVMAPLLGVVLTVVGFYWLKVGDENQSLGTILWAVTPLVSGVGTGAVLALVNQVLLHFASRRVESLRMTARNWFDAEIWSRSRSDDQTTPNAVQVTDDLVKSALEDIDRLTDTLARAAEISAAISALPDQIRNVLDRKLSFEHEPTSQDSSERFVAHIPRAAK